MRNKAELTAGFETVRNVLRDAISRGDRGIIGCRGIIFRFLRGLDDLELSGGQFCALTKAELNLLESKEANDEATS